MTRVINIFKTLAKIQSKSKYNCYPKMVSNKFLFSLIFMQIHVVILRHFISVKVPI